MDLNQINNFLSVAQTLSFSGAARRNGVPQSTVSRHISDLESELSVKLFYRTKRDVKLTDEGRAFLPYAKEIVETARKATYVVKQLHDGAEGHLSIAVADDIGSDLLSRCLWEFSRRYPHILVDITDGASTSLALEELENPFDFHFIPRDGLPEGDDFDFLETHREELSVVVSRHHPMAEKPLQFSALQGEKFLVVSEEANPLLYLQTVSICRAHHFAPTISNRLDTVKAVLLSVSAGLGVTILPDSLPRTILPELVSILPITDMDTALSYGIAWKKELLNPAAVLFLEVLREILPQKNHHD